MSGTHSGDGYYQNGLKKASETENFAYAHAWTQKAKASVVFELQAIDVLGSLASLS